MESLIRPVGALMEMARIATVSVSSINKGSDSDFTITMDEDNVAIPNRIYVAQVMIIPSAATIFRVRLYAKAARTFADPLMYEYPFGMEDESFGNDASGFYLYNRDGSNPNTIFGNIAVDAGGAAAASFNVFILFIEGGQ